MPKVYLYISSYQVQDSTTFKNQVVEEKIDFEEIDIVSQNRKHFDLSFIPCLIIEDDLGNKIKTFEPRKGVLIDWKEVKDIIKNPPVIKKPKTIKEQYKEVKTADEKFSFIEKFLGLV